MTRSSIRSLLEVSAAASLLAAAAAAAAQESGAVCTGLKSQAAEIACLRALLAEGQPGPEEDKSPSTATPAPPARPALPGPAESRLGAEQIRSDTHSAADNGRAERLEATVVETRRDRRGLLVMQLENGEIWRQEESPGVPIRFDPDGPTRVEISRSGFGGYRMHFPEAGRRMVVSRLR